MIEKELLTTVEAARLLGIGTRTLHRWSKEGKTPKPIKFGPGRGASVRYRRAELLTRINAGCPQRDEMEGQDNV